MTMLTDYDVVIPTIGRPSLQLLLRSLTATAGPPPERIIIVDDRPEPRPIDTAALGELTTRVAVVHSGAKGPAAARNAGWRSASATWVAFLDDDVVVAADWRAALATDLASAANAAATQGRVHVPLPIDRRATDWERNVAGLATAAWITADMAYRRDVLAALGGFDERFRRAFREDADLALRAQAAGYLLVRGSRTIDHPVRAAGPWISVQMQAGNGDDVLMCALHGNDWFERADAPRGCWNDHAATVVCAFLAGIGFISRHRRSAALASIAWAAFTARFAWRRIAPGPRSAREIATMLVTSTVIPFAAVYHRLATLAVLRYRLRERHLSELPL